MNFKNNKINGLRFKSKGIKMPSQFAPRLPTTKFILTANSVDYHYYDDEAKHGKIPQKHLSELLHGLATGQYSNVEINGLQLGDNNSLKCLPNWTGIEYKD